MTPGAGVLLCTRNVMSRSKDIAVTRAVEM